MMRTRRSHGGGITGYGAGDHPHEWRGMRAAVLSFLLPGAGQLWSGPWRRGAALMVVSLASVILAAVLALRDLRDLASLLVRPAVLEVILVVNVLVLAFRAFAVVDAYRCAHDRSRVPSDGPGSTAGAPDGRHLVRAAGATLALLMVLPHAAVAYYALEGRATLGGVFPGTAAHAADSRSVPHPEAWQEDGRLTVLLVGSDAGPRRSGTRTDTIMVASVDVGSGEAALISIPRNLVRVPLPAWAPSDLRCRCFPDPINGLYAHYRERTELVDDGVDPGAAVLRGAVELLIGVRIDHYAIVDLRGFVDAVDALGGVTVDVERRIYDQLDSPDAGEWDAIDLHPGRHHLDGRQALVYVRTRRNASDYARMNRQRCFLGALLDQTGTAEVLRTFPRLSTIIRSALQTDLPREALPDLVELAGKVQPSTIAVLSVTPPELASRDMWGYPVADGPLVRSSVRRLLAADEVTDGADAADAAVPEAPIRETTTSVPARSAQPPPSQPLARSCSG